MVMLELRPQWRWALTSGTSCSLRVTAVSRSILAVNGPSTPHSVILRLHTADPTPNIFNCHFLPQPSGRMSNEGRDISIGGNTAKPSSSLNRLISCPYKVLVNSNIIDEFYDVRDAISAARNTKAKNPNSQVIVCDEPSGRLIIEV